MINKDKTQETHMKEDSASETVEHELQEEKKNPDPKEAGEDQNIDIEENHPLEEGGAEVDETTDEEEIANEQYLGKIKALEEQSLRIRAEFANYKRRVEREQVEFADYIKAEIIKPLLPILDDFKMMFEKSSAANNEQSVLEGAKLIYDKFTQILEKEGLKRIMSLGETFDPQIHDALMMKPIDNAEQHNKIVDVFQEGYTLNDKLLRPSKVIVGVFENN